MIDVHCHLNFHKFEEDYDSVIKDAVARCVTKIINTGTSISSSRHAVKLAQEYENLYAIVGIHPHHADKLGSPSVRSSVDASDLKTDKEFEGEIQDNWLEKLDELAKQPKVVGIGEIGMDYFAYRSNGIVEKELQEDAFRKQIELSIKHKLPVQIHNRLAWEDTLGILLEYKDQLQEKPGMFHCFSGSIPFLKRVLEAGFYVGFDGNVTYKGIPPGEDTALVDLVTYAPLDRIVVETDSPYLTPIPLRGQRNTPTNVIIVGEFIAQAKGVSFEEVDQVTTTNALELFQMS